MEKEEAKVHASYEIMTMEEDGKQKVNRNKLEEVPLEESVVQQNEKESSHKRIKKAGKVFLVVSLIAVNLFFVILLLGVAGGISPPTL